MHHVELAELQPQPSGEAPPLAHRLDLFGGVKATVTVSAGSAAVSVGELMSLKEGVVLTLDREIDAPFDVILDGRVLARGQLVAVGQSFGLRVSEICTPTPR
jgi:flagellar motor switch protein FliN/FliY